MERKRIAEREKKKKKERKSRKIDKSIKMRKIKLQKASEWLPDSRNRFECLDNDVKSVMAVLKACCCVSCRVYVRALLIRNKLISFQASIKLFKSHHTHRTHNRLGGEKFHVLETVYLFY